MFRNWVPKLFSVPYQSDLDVAIICSHLSWSLGWKIISDRRPPTGGQILASIQLAFKQKLKRSKIFQKSYKLTLGLFGFCVTSVLLFWLSCLSKSWWILKLLSRLFTHGNNAGGTNGNPPSGGIIGPVLVVSWIVGGERPVVTGRWLVICLRYNWRIWGSIKPGNRFMVGRVVAGNVGELFEPVALGTVVPVIFKPASEGLTGGVVWAKIEGIDKFKGFSSVAAVLRSDWLVWRRGESFCGEDVYPDSSLKWKSFEPVKYWIKN